MVRRRGRPSQGWHTFLRNHAPDIVGMDLFVVPTIGFDLLYAFVIVRLDRRDLVWIDVTTNPTAEWIARQLTEAFPWDEAPKYLIRDRDRIYGASVTRRIRAMGIRDRPTAPASPWQNGYAERLIGSIRRECVDHFIILGETHLRRVLRSYAEYYNRIRTHRSLDKDAPIPRLVQRTGIIRARAVLGGLHHQYVRVWVFGTHSCVDQLRSPLTSDNQHLEHPNDGRGAGQPFCRALGRTPSPDASSAARFNTSINTSNIVGTPSGISVCSATVRAANGINHRNASAVFSHGTKPRAKPLAARNAIAGAKTTKS